MNKETALATTQKRKLESEVVLYSGSPEISKELEKAQTLNQKDFYKVAGKTVPSARALQWLANRKQIKTQIIDIQSDKTYCRATVGGWLGNKSEPKSNQIYKEATVEMIFEIEMAEKMLEIIRKENLQRDKDWEIDEDGKPVITNPKFQHKLMIEMLRLRKFALRTIITKAERIIHSKLADVEWRDEDEMDDEQNEVELVSGKRVDVTPVKSTVKQCAECGNAIPNDNKTGLCVNCMTTGNEERPFQKSTEPPYIHGSDTPVPEPESMTEMLKTEYNAEVITVQSDTTIPSNIISNDKTPREALNKIMEYAMSKDLGDEVRPVIIDHYPEYDDGNRAPYHIPESKVVEIVEELTGIKMKRVERAKACKTESCKNKVTTPESKEQKGKCLECWMKETDQ